MSSERIRILGIMLVAVVALAVGETLLSKGMKLTEQAPAGWTNQALAILRNGWVWAGCALMVLHVGLYMLALRKADLSFVLPLTAGSYPLATLLAKVYLREEVGTLRWAGTLIITIGVAIVGLGEAADH